MSGTISPHVMVVDDEPMIRQLVTSVLTASGYRVTNADSSEHAVQLLDTAASFDLLVTDIVMPGVNGYQLADSMLAKKPGLRVLFMSGYEPAAVGAPKVPGASFLRKPFRISDLIERVQQLLMR